MLQFSTRVLMLQAGGCLLRATADQLFRVERRGWVRAADLRVGAQLRGRDGQPVTVEEITDCGEQTVVVNDSVDISGRLHPVGFAAGTLIETADGLKRIEDVKPGDRIVVRPPLD